MFAYSVCLEENVCKFVCAYVHQCAMLWAVQQRAIFLYPPPPLSPCPFVPSKPSVSQMDHVMAAVPLKCSLCYTVEISRGRGGPPTELNFLPKCGVIFTY